MFWHVYTWQYQLRDWQSNISSSCLGRGLNYLTTRCQCYMQCRTCNIIHICTQMHVHLQSIYMYYMYVRICTCSNIFPFTTVCMQQYTFYMAILQVHVACIVTCTAVCAHVYIHVDVPRSFDTPLFPQGKPTVLGSVEVPSKYSWTTVEVPSTYGDATVELPLKYGQATEDVRMCYCPPT